MYRSVKLEAFSQRPSVSVVVLLGNTGLMNFGFSMFVPLLAIHYTQHLGFAAAAIGLVLALRQFSQQGLDVIGGAFGDRFGARRAIAIGCFVRAAGFVGIGASTSLAPLLLWAIVSGLGGAFFDATSTAALADLVEPERRQRMFATSAMLANVGQATGPLVGVALLDINFMTVSVIAAACFVLVGVLTLTLLPPTLLRGEAAVSRASGHLSSLNFGLGGTLRILWRDRTFVWLTCLLAGFWFLWAQINITVPLAALQIGGPKTGRELTALAFALYAGSAIFLQYPLTRLVGERYRVRTILVVAVALSGAGMTLVFATSLIPMFVLGIAIFAVGRMLIGPTINEVTAQLAPAGMYGAYFGFGALAIGVGAGLGQYLGGFLFDIATAAHQPALLWGPLVVIGVGCTAGLARLRLPDSHAGAEPVVASVVSREG